MDEQELLIKLKKSLRITGDYQNDTLLQLISEVKEDMKGMGVSEQVVNSKSSIGAITKGVWDKDNLHEYSLDFEKQIIRLREKR
jgi:hypothetical protein